MATVPWIGIKKPTRLQFIRKTKDLVLMIKKVKRAKGAVRKMVATLKREVISTIGAQAKVELDLKMVMVTTKTTCK